MIGFLLGAVGSRIGRIAGLALVVILILFGLIRYGQSIERTKVENQDLRQTIEIRDRIDESIQDTRGNSPQQSLDRLRQRQSTQ